MIKTVQELIDSLERFKVKYGNAPVVCESSRTS